MTPLKMWTLALALVAVCGFGQGVRVALGIATHAPVSFAGAPPAPVGEAGLDATTFRTASAHVVRPLAPATQRDDLALEGAP